MPVYTPIQNFVAQLPEPENDPFFFDLVASLRPGLDGDISDNDKLFDDFLDPPSQADWDALERGPFQDLLEQDAFSLGAYVHTTPAQNSNSCANTHFTIPLDLVPNPSPADAIPMSSVVGGRFVCSVSGCQKSYKRRAERSRHALTHTAARNFTCSAEGCPKAFTRKDKLVDHMRAGHDADELFRCPKTTCGAYLTRDVFPLHVEDFSYISKHRKCPMPKCKFTIADTRSRSLNDLQAHLLNEHDTRGRMKFADVLAVRGYHYEHVEIMCPLCPEFALFENHGTFYQHFIVGHRPGLTAPSEESLRTLDAGQGYGNGAAQQALRECKVYCQEVGVHRYTILSLWPEFEDHPVWDDVKHCSG